jgi:hypothetical protein
MDDFLDQVEAAANDGRFYFLALAGAMAIPDICGALGANNGEARRSLYEAWFDANVAPLNVAPTHFGAPHAGRPFLTGADCYWFRCAYLHQGRTRHPRSGYSRILFIEPRTSGVRIHMAITNDALVIDVGMFCGEVVGAARQWLAAQVGTQPFDTNLAASVQRHPTGLAQFIGGVSVIS